MLQLKTAAALALLSFAASAQATVSASASIDSFMFSVVDTDPTDGITTTMTLDSGESYAATTINFLDTVFYHWANPASPAQPISNHTDFAGHGSANVFNNGSTQSISADMLRATSGIHEEFGANTYQNFGFTLNGPGAVVFYATYSLGASNDAPRSGDVNYANVTLNGRVDYSDGLNSYFGAHQDTAHGPQSGKLKTSFYNDVSSAHGYVTASAYVTVGRDVAPVPEPSEYLMLLAGLGVIGYAVRRRQA